MMHVLIEEMFDDMIEEVDYLKIKTHIKLEQE